MLTWLRENRDGPYWRHGSVRADGGGTGYDRIDCAVMLVAGWADGYRNNSFRTVAALEKAGVPHRLLAGPWVHAAPATAYPGPRLDLDVEMAAWFDRWLRGRDEDGHRDGVEVFVRRPAAPEPDLEEHPGRWVRDAWPSDGRSTDTRSLDGTRAMRSAGRPRPLLCRWSWPCPDQTSANAHLETRQQSPTPVHVAAGLSRSRQEADCAAGINAPSRTRLHHRDSE